MADNDVYAEIAMLRAELDIALQQGDDTRALCYGHVDQRDLDRARQDLADRDTQIRDLEADLSRMVGLEAEARRKLENARWRIAKLKQTIDAFPDANEAANLAHARSQRDTWRAMHHEVEKERDEARAELLRIYQLAVRDNIAGTLAAALKLGEVLDGGT